MSARIRRFIVQTLWRLRWWRSLHWLCRLTGDVEGADYAIYWLHRDWWASVINRMQRSYARVGACKQLTDEILWLVYAILEKDQEGLAAILENIETQIRWLQKRTESQ
ncbi:MAG: hypothetical protein QOG67_2546 [Verrucomicrobiota bacterium]